MKGVYLRFRERASAFDGARAIEAPGESLSYGDFYERIEDQSRCGPTRTLPEGSRVIVQARNPLDILITVLEVWANGLIPVVLDANAPTAHAIEIAERLKASSLYRHGVWSAPTGKEQPLLNPVGPERDEALVLMTSGTSGDPKAVALPAGSVIVNTDSIARAFRIGPGDRMLVSLPLSHAYGLVCMCFAGLWAGATLCLRLPTTPIPLLLPELRASGITIVQGTPTFHQLLARHWNGCPFGTVRLLTVGAEVCGVTLAERLFEMFPEATAYAVYGMTEMGPRVSHIDLRDPRFRQGSIGRPYDHVEWKVVPAQDGEPGSGILALRGPGCFKGYITPDGTYTGLDADGWFHSRDVVRVDPDGSLFLLGRRDGSIKIGDRLVFPAVVERCLMQMPRVLAARVNVLADPVSGHALEAEVVVDAGSSISTSDVLRHCAEELERSHIPKTVVVVDRLETGPTGKRRLG